MPSVRQRITALTTTVVTSLALCSLAPAQAAHAATPPTENVHSDTHHLVPRHRRDLTPKYVSLSPTYVRPYRYEGESDSRIYHSSEEWGWLNYPGKVVPGGRILNITRHLSCSTGWIVGLGKRVFILTAGHCGKIGDQFAISDEQGNTAIVGEMVECVYIHSGDTDYGLIEFYNTRYVDSALPLREKVVGWRTPEWLEANRPRVCHLGFRTGQSCGAFLTTQDNGIIQFRGVTDHGDSGGPTYVLVNGSIYAVGVTSYLMLEDATRVGSQSIAPAMERWGLTLYA